MSCIRNVVSIPVLRVEGKVVKGFGRGSKLLGIPTANLPVEVVNSIEGIENMNGVYCGWAQLDGKDVLKTVMSIGDNPHFQNQQKSIEPYIVHDFGKDFYEAHLKLVIVGHLRDQQKYDSLEALIAAIKKDIAVGVEVLDGDSFKQYQNDLFFSQ